MCSVYKKHLNSRADVKKVTSAYILRSTIFIEHSNRIIGGDGYYYVNTFKKSWK